MVPINANGVLITEVLLHRTAYCGPNGVLLTEVCTGQLTVVPMVSFLQRFVQDSLLWSQWCPYYRVFTVSSSCGVEYMQ